jgi:hypothetical protein
LASPQLFEFDTDDQKAQSVFQLYGQSFDKVKKYIDNNYPVSLRIWLFMF